MNKLSTQLYNFIKWNLGRSENFTITYGTLAFLYDVEMCAVYDALNRLVNEKGLVVDAVKCLGDGDYEVKFT